MVDHRRVFALPDLLIAEIAGANSLGQRVSVRPLELDLALHADVPHGAVLDEPPVLGERCVRIAGCPDACRR